MRIVPGSFVATRPVRVLIVLATLLFVVSCGGNRSTSLERRIVPAGVTLTPGKAQAFEVQPPAGTPTWSLDTGPGLISAEGVYQAPFIFHGEREVIVRARFDDLSSGPLTNHLYLIAGLPDSANCCGVSQAFPANGDYLYVDELPEAIFRLAPEYPDSARAAGVQGTVIIQALVCRNGLIFTTLVVQSVPMLDRAAVEAVEQWRFMPARIGGQPVAVWVVIPIRFTLHGPVVAGR